MLSKYSLLERSLHWLALEPMPVRQLAFDLERLHSLPHRPSAAERAAGMTDPADGAVYVCGLARSGTTILLQILDQLDCFRSPTYRDMPFVLAPNLWRKISRFAQRESSLAERPHGDGMMVGYDSPEAFEEVFWRTFGTTRLNKNSFDYDPPSTETLEAFADYRALVANPRSEPRPAGAPFKRYLSKNNNNLLRLPALCADPTATVLLVYRDPIETALSLHRVHMRFCEAQRANPFMRRYMKWLGHHEFGLDHRPFAFAISSLDSSLKPDSPDYWLDYWIAVHLNILNSSESKFWMSSHNRLCGTPLSSIRSILGVLDIAADPTPLAQNVSERGLSQQAEEYFSESRLRHAKDIHEQLLRDKRNLQSGVELDEQQFQ